MGSEMCIRDRTWTADDGNELSEAEMEALVNGLAYKNTDDAPTVSNNRVVTITSMKDRWHNRCR